MADHETLRLPVPLLDGERAQEHDDLTREAAEILRAWIAKRAIICNHTQVLEYPEAADELMKVFGARIGELRDQYDRVFTALQRRTEEWEGEQAARIAAEQATIAADQRAKQAEAERDELRRELDAIRTRDETVGGVLYDVVRQTQAGELDEHEAVRAIDARLIHPLVAREREARARAARSGRRRRDTVGQRNAAAELTAERDDARRDLTTAQGEIDILHNTIVDLHAQLEQARAGSEAPSA